MSVGWNRDVIYCSIGSLAWVWAEIQAIDRPASPRWPGSGYGLFMRAVTPGGNLLTLSRGENETAGKNRQLRQHGLPVRR